MDNLEVLVKSVLEEMNRSSLSYTAHISESDRLIFEVINFVILCQLIGLFGLITNVINMIIFYRQGLDTTINISFFALAISDLWSLLFQQCYNVFVNPLFERSVPHLAPSEIQYVIAGVPRESFSRITCLITVYITAERCLCIAFPLHIKQMITPRRTTLVMIAVYSLTVLSVAPLCYTTYIDWKFYPDKNTTLLGLAYTSNREYVEGIVLVIHAIIGSLSFLAVIVLTMILIRNLGQKSRWRQTASVDIDKTESMSSRDRKAVTMVVLIASVLIISYTPSAVMFMTTFVEPEFSISGKYARFFVVAWSFGFLFETINSSVNIFMYFKMSTKFRISFRELFSKYGYFDDYKTKHENN